MSTALLTVISLIAFAANSLFARLALASVSIDPASYTAVRLGSGAVTLWFVVRFLRNGKPAVHDGGWGSAAMLFLYAAAFSFAYISLAAGTGALILFAAVQITMIAAGLYAGERPSLLHWLGLVLAIAGLVFLVSPGVTAPSPTGSVLMGTAGVAWGAYSILGRGADRPVHATEQNFFKSVPFALVPLLLGWGTLAVSAEGLLWASLSGSITSAVGYVIWYAALRGLSATLAATLQLSVPVLAALGGILFLSEEMTWRLGLSGVVILTGVGLAIRGRRG